MADMSGGSPPPESLPPNFSHSRHANQTLNAVSFGFIATAVLFAMFLVMAIFERILRPHRAARAATRDEERAESAADSTAESQKPDSNAESYSKGVSVLMPGQDYPTYFARPVPPPCPRESASRLPHDEVSGDLEMGRGETSGSVVNDSLPSQAQVTIHVEKEKGESSSPPSPGKKSFQDGQEAKR
ncbi:hypothetical protein R1sor_012281 [Riccia sorocarpa]|uniref:Uncharacterized protein n=1 Tax=Riccia sorocarpa TaxID=122646 RepID=A0ABD3I3C0_9MARC